jgi:hypothetical protein
MKKGTEYVERQLIADKTEAAIIRETPIKKNMLTSD